jgi:hypothetical protein
MKKQVKSFLLILFASGILVVDPGCTPKTFKISFDSSKEVSGTKFAIKDISPGLPRNWDDYNFVVLELKSSTPQRFQVGFTTETGYNEVRVMSYAANGWIKLAIPLKFYRELPGAARDLAATFNQPRYTGWINLNLDGHRGPLHSVDSIGIRMLVPINNPTIELRSITLAADDPGDQYLENTPLVDEFGQWNLGNFDGKAHSLEQLKSEWQKEDEEVVTTGAYNYSKYGGYLNAKVKGTGFFRTEKIDGRWWFVDPEGYLFLSAGVDCVAPGGGGEAVRIDKRRNFYKVLPPDTIGTYRSRPNSASFGTWNLFRRYGDKFPEKSRELIIKRMDKWGLNTICNWSSAEVIKLNRKAFMIQMRSVGGDSRVMGLADVYQSDFSARVDASCKAFTGPYKDNPWLIGYFLGNEPSWLGQESRLCNLILALNEETPLKAALTKFLAEGDTPERRKEFIISTFRIYLETLNNSLKRYDPNHLNLGMRFGRDFSDEVIAACKNVFDVFSFNCYFLYPKPDLMDKIMKLTDLPMIIGEYHFGTVDRGMAQALWQVNSQQERGVAYRYYTERAYSHPGLIGTAYFQWSDQDFTGRSNDGENYNCGLVDVTDRPYKYQVEAMMETARRICDIHLGMIPPYDQEPVKARGHRVFPDIWNK